METISLGIRTWGFVNGNNAECRACFILFNCLTLSGCQLKSWKFNGNGHNAVLNFDVEGTPEQLTIFRAAYDGATN